MIIAILPGFARGASEFVHWKQLLPGEVELFDLPGHADVPEISEPTLANLAAYYASQIPAGALIVGESLGGLIGLAMAPRGYRVAAFDPPLSTAKQWLLQQYLPPLVARNSGVKWIPNFVDTRFGITPSGVFEERNYWPLLDALPEPAHVIAAGESLWPKRDAPQAPSVLDDIDAFHLARHPQVLFRRISGPHTLLTDSIEPAKAALLEIIEACAG